MATSQERETFEGMWLGDTEKYGAPDLREAIAATYANQSASDTLCFAGASEGIFAANQVILDPDSHAIVVTPNYRSHETLPVAICEATGVPLNPNDNWSLDIDRVAAAIRPNTKLVTINFPHNPTGAILPLERYKTLVELCRKHGIYILHDEIFNGLGETDTRHLPFIADIYERDLSLNVMSKSYSLPGLRIGWIACQDAEIISKRERLKHYLSICNSGLSERLTMITLRNKGRILARNCAIVNENLPKWDAFLPATLICLNGSVPMDHAWHSRATKGPKGLRHFVPHWLSKAACCSCPARSTLPIWGQRQRTICGLGLGAQT